MKHIFTVHSPVTFLCAYSVCKELSIPEKEVIMYSSGYKVPFKYGNVVQSFDKKYRSLWSKLLRFNMPKAFDTYIDELTNNEPFIAYIDIMHYWQRILITHKNCKSFNFIEEGMVNYHKPDTLEEITFLIRSKSFRIENAKEYVINLVMSLRGYNPRLFTLPYWAMAYTFLQNTRFYCFSLACYPGVDKSKKQVIPFYGHTNQQGYSLKNAIVWIEDLYNYRHVPEKEFIEAAIEKAALYLNQKYGSTHKHLVKTRPRWNAEDGDVPAVLDKRNIKYDIIDADEPFELVLKRSQNLILVSATSSLCYYGKLMEHKAYTYFWDLQERKESAFERMDFYWNVVNKIP